MKAQPTLSAYRIFDLDSLRTLHESKNYMVNELSKTL